MSRLRKLFRSSITGEFVRKGDAEANPDTTQEEHVREPFDVAWCRFVDSEEYKAALYYAATQETRAVALRTAFEAGRAS